MSGGQVVTKAEWLALKQEMQWPEVIGVDEAGRGSIAGPVVVGAWGLQHPIRASDGAWIGQLRDSKQLSPQRRAQLRNEMDNAPYSSGFGEQSALLIDKHGISFAVCEAARIALYRVWTPRRRNIPVLFDGTSGNWLGIRSFMESHFEQWYFLEKADSIDVAVMGASVLAKTRHDYVMDCLVADNMGRDPWNWRSNQGYGTKEHIEAIKGKAGVSGEHRMTFAPMKYLFT